VIGELALGRLSRRSEILGLINNLPRVKTATDLEVLDLVENRHLLGLGYLDAHLLASTLLTADTGLWTRDERLASAATALGLAQQVTRSPERPLPTSAALALRSVGWSARTGLRGVSGGGASIPPRPGECAEPRGVSRCGARGSAVSSNRPSLKPLTVRGRDLSYLVEDSGSTDCRWSALALLPR